MRKMLGRLETRFRLYFKINRIAFHKKIKLTSFTDGIYSKGSSALSIEMYFCAHVSETCVKQQFKDKASW
jgi:hypothetical protein